MGVSTELPPRDLRRRLDPAELPFETTADVAPLDGVIGQPRALDALAFAVEIDAPGYNVFAAGPSGSGRRRAVRDHLERIAPERARPDDWVYVNDFDRPDRPRALRMPAGRGRALARDMERFVETAREAIPRALESEDFARGREAATAETARRQDALTQELQDFARERGFGCSSRRPES